MQNTQPDTAKKLRDAIGEMQQNELESRMRWTAEALPKGLGSYAVMREAPVTRQLEELRDKLSEAQGAMTAGSKSATGDQALQQALERASKLRRDLQTMAASGKPGNQTGKVGDQPEKPGDQQRRSSGQAKDGEPGSQPAKSQSQSGSPSNGRQQAQVQGQPGGQQQSGQ